MNTVSSCDELPLGHELNADEIVETFALFDDWEDRYRYIIDLGCKLPTLPEALRTEDRYVHGCQSQVWFDHHVELETGKLQFILDSDALIARGLAGILLAALNGKTPAEILSYDVEGYFEHLDLLRHISPSRGNGLRAMLEKMRACARAAA